MKKWIPFLLVVGCLLAIGLIAFFVPAIRTNLLSVLTGLGYFSIGLVLILEPIAFGIGIYFLNEHFVENWVVKTLIIVLAGILAMVVNTGLVTLFTGFMPVLEDLGLIFVSVMSLVLYGFTVLVTWYSDSFFS